MAVQNYHQSSQPFRSLSIHLEDDSDTDIDSFEKIGDLVSYAQNTTLSPYDWVKVTIKIRDIERHGGVCTPMQIYELGKLIFNTGINRFSLKQRDIVAAFYARRAPDNRTYQLFLSSLIDQCDFQDLEDTVKKHAKNFNTSLWLQVFDRILKSGVPNATAIAKGTMSQYVDKENVIVDMDIIGDFLKKNGVSINLDKENEEARQLTSKLNNAHHKTNVTFDRYLTTCLDNVAIFNKVHWAVAAGKIFQASGCQDVNIERHTLKINLLIDHLVESNIFRFDSGLLAQIIGGFLPLLDPQNNKHEELLEIFYSAIKEQLVNFEKKELIMILEALRTTKGNNSAFFDLIFDHCFSRRCQFDLSKHIDLFVCLVQGWAKNGQPAALFMLEGFIEKHVSKFNRRELIQVIHGLGEHIFKCTPFLEKDTTVSSILDELHKQVQDSRTDLSAREITGLLLSLDNLRYVDIKWFNYCIEKAKTFHVWEKIIVIGCLANQGFLTLDTSQEIRDWVIKTAEEYSDPLFDTLRPKYPADSAKLVYALTLLDTGVHSLSLVQKIIEKSAGFAKTRENITSFKHAIALSNSPVNISSDSDMQNDDFIPGKLDTQVKDEITRRIDGLKVSAVKILPGIEFKGNFILMEIQNLAADGKSIMVDLEGPRTRSCNSPDGKKPWMRGKTISKHMVIKEGGYHHVVISADRPNYPILEKIVDPAWEKILSL